MLKHIKNFSEYQMILYKFLLNQLGNAWNNKNFTHFSPFYFANPISDLQLESCFFICFCPH